MSRARTQAYTSACSELTVYKSRMDVAVLQAEDQVTRLTSEAEEARRRYEQVRCLRGGWATAGPTKAWLTRTQGHCCLSCRTITLLWNTAYSGQGWVVLPWSVSCLRLTF